MSNLDSSSNIRKQWQAKITQANQNNIYCHCRLCGREWIDSETEVKCACGNKEVETIACWQFPDG